MHGLSQQKLADELSLKRNNIASYEAGIVEPKALNFIKFALFFGLAPSELFERKLSSGGISGESSREGEIKELQQFASKTQELQKVLDGFREFAKFRKKHALADAPGIPEHAGELLDIMGRLLESNWKLLHTILEEEE